MTNTTFHKAGVARLAAVGFAAAIGFTALPAAAAPLGGASLSETVKTVQAPIENVKCRAGCAAAIGVGAGIVTGAIIANQARRDRYYYDDGYDPGPSYYNSGYRSSGYGRCWVETNPHRQTGYWTRC